MPSSFFTSTPLREVRLVLLAVSLGLGSGACELVIGEIPAEAFDLVDSGVSTLDDPDGGENEPDQVSELPNQEADPSPSADPSDGEQPYDGDCARPVAWYADQDGDGHGAGPAHPLCEEPGNGWSNRGGDCADNDPLVFPGQKTFFGIPFVRTTGSESFDYDCSGKEEGNPGQALEPQCETMPGPNCGASGYTKSTRTASGANAYCGSHSVESCKSTIAVVLCRSAIETVSAPYACH